MFLMQEIAADVIRVRSELHERGFHDRIIQGLFLRSRNRSSVGAVNKVDRDLKGYFKGNLLFFTGVTADFQANSWGQKFDALKKIVSQDESFF
jgi:hypothetical protein